MSRGEHAPGCLSRGWRGGLVATNRGYTSLSWHFFLVYLKINLIRGNFKLSHMFQISQISVLKVLLFIPGKYSSDA